LGGGEMTEQPIRTKPEPYCPECGAQMRLRKPRENQTWEAFWGCSQYPECKGARNILPDGTPEEDDDQMELDW